LKLLDRYIVREVLSPFLFGVVTFTTLILSIDTMMRATRMLTENHFAVSLVVKYVLASVPVPLAYSFPMSSLLACLMAFGRLSSDTEITAMKAGGISLYRIALPGLLLMFCFSLVDLYLTDRIVPQASYEANSITLRQMGKDDDALVKNFNSMKDVAEDGTDRQIIAREFDVDKGRMKVVTVQFYQQSTDNLVRQMRADYADYSDNGWVMYNVHTQDFDPEGNVTDDSRSETLSLPLDKSPRELNTRARGRQECTREMLLTKIRIEMRTHEGRVTTKVHQYLVEYYTRLAVPFSCVVFALFGIPLGMQPQRSSKSMGLGQSIVFIFIYYLLLSFSRVLGENGVLPEMIAVWLPNLLFGGVGTVLLNRAGKI
jgi:lipopolysaccharide export system permease protein